MDEYFCPKCGAILNNQYGFDPDGGTWRCTECGELLMDDDVYSGDTFEGVAWYCDNCGALLNRQYGFSDSFGSWTCTECGHRNGTTEEDIISEDEPEFICPSCGVALDFQPGFDKYDDDWECTACGAHLHHSYSSDQYSVVEEPKFRCPNCGAGIDGQWLFGGYEDDWECTECGAKLHRDYSFEQFELVEDGDTDEEDDESDEEDDTSSYSYEGYRSQSCSSSSNEDRTYRSPHTTMTFENSSTSSVPRKKIPWKIKLFTTLGLIVLLLVTSTYYEMSLLIPVGFSSSELVGMQYERVVARLKSSGFSSVSTNDISDLKVSQLSQENLVTEIKIGFSDAFTKTSKYPSNFPVTVTYHTLECFDTPMSNKEAKGSDYSSVENSFRDAGFENIVIEVDYDIITGWLTDVGEVESVTVNGDKKFAKGASYRADAEIIITYHDLRKNKPK